MTLPTALAVAEHVADLERGAYTYKPTIGYVVTGTLTLNDQIYMRPRLSDTCTRVLLSGGRAVRGSAAPSST